MDDIVPVGMPDQGTDVDIARQGTDVDFARQGTNVDFARQWVQLIFANSGAASATIQDSDAKSEAN